MTTGWHILAAGRYEQLITQLEASLPLHEMNVIALSNLYLVACFCYYEHDHSIMSDHLFDRVAKELSGRYVELMCSSAWFLELFDLEALDAGSGYHLKGHYPAAIEQIASVFLQRAGVQLAMGAA